MFKDWYHMLGKKKEIYSNSAAIFCFLFSPNIWNIKLNRVIVQGIIKVSFLNTQKLIHGAVQKNAIQRDHVFTKYMTHEILDLKEEVPGSLNDER